MKPIPIKIKLKMRETAVEFAKKLRKAIAEDLNKVFRAAAPIVEAQVRQNVFLRLINSPEYLSLKGGRLRLDFGIEDVRDVDVVVQYWVDHITIERKPVKVGMAGLTGGFTINCIESNFQKIIDDVPEGFYVSEPSEELIFWLDWLLLHGTSLVVHDWHVLVSDSVIGRSRTDHAIMVRRGGYHVPPEFAGTESDNWATRALKDLNDDIEKILIKVISKEVDSL